MANPDKETQENIDRVAATAEHDVYVAQIAGKISTLIAGEQQATQMDILQKAVAQLELDEWVKFEAGDDD